MTAAIAAAAAADAGDLVTAVMTLAVIVASNADATDYRIAILRILINTLKLHICSYWVITRLPLGYQSTAIKMLPDF